MADLTPYLQDFPNTTECVPAKVDRSAEELAARSNVLRYLPARVYGDVLDVGCAGGWGIRELGRRYPACEVLGVTLFEVERAECEGRGLSAVVADMHALPADWTGRAGMVYASHVLEHSPAPYVVLREFHRVLGRGGWLILVMPDEQAYTRLGAGKRPVRMDTFAGHVFCAGTDTVIHLMRKAGFLFERYHEVPQTSLGVLEYCHRVFVGRKPTRGELNHWVPSTEAAPE